MRTEAKTCLAVSGMARMGESKQEKERPLHLERIWTE